MKRIFTLILVILVALISFGCQGTKTSTINNGEDQEDIKYKVDQILLSKSFQSTEPSVEVMTKKDRLKLLVSLGLTESSGVKVNKIVRDLNDINIHVSSIYKNGKLQLAVPQVILEIKKSDLGRVDDLKFNIVNDDYRPLKIKLGMNEVLSKVESHFKISSSGSPLINLSRLKDNIVWDISYYSIFDKDNIKTPLINLTTTVDANTGDFLKSEKTFISTSIDDGHILDYSPEEYILYKKSIINPTKEKSEEQLWSYNISSKEKEMIFSSNFKIYSSKYNHDLSYISIIETSDNGTGLYVVPRSNKKAYKISFEDNFNPDIMTWKDDDNLYLIDNIDDKSLVFSYNVEENISSRLAHLNKTIENLIIKDDMFLIVEASEDNHNKGLSLTFDWKKFEFIADGFSPHFIGDDILAYLKNDAKVNTNSLILYNLKTDRNIKTILENISAFQVLSNNSIAYVKKNPTHKDFILSQYSLKDKDTTDIAPLVSDKVYYDEEAKALYTNISIPFENDKQEMIYLINLSNLN